MSYLPRPTRYCFTPCYSLAERGENLRLLPRVLFHHHHSANAHPRIIHFLLTVFTNVQVPLPPTPQKSTPYFSLPHCPLDPTTAPKILQQSGSWEHLNASSSPPLWQNLHLDIILNGHTYKIPNTEVLSGEEDPFSFYSQLSLSTYYCEEIMLCGFLQTNAEFIPGLTQDFLAVSSIILPLNPSHDSHRCSSTPPLSRPHSCPVSCLSLEQVLSHSTPWECCCLVTGFCTAVPYHLANQSLAFVFIYIFFCFTCQRKCVLPSPMKVSLMNQLLKDHSPITGISVISIFSFSLVFPFLGLTWV